MIEQPKKTDNNQQPKESLDLKKKEIRKQNLKERLLSVLANLDSVKEAKSLFRDIKRDIKNITKKQIIGIFLFFLITGSIAAYTKWTEVPKLNIFGDIEGIELYLDEKKLELGNTTIKGDSRLAEVWIKKGSHVLNIKKGGKEILKVEQEFSLDRLYFIYIGEKWLKIDHRNCKYNTNQTPHKFYNNIIEMNVDGEKQEIHFQPDERIKAQVKFVLGFTSGICRKPALTSFYKNAKLIFPCEEIPIINSREKSEWRIVLRYMTNGEQSFCSHLLLEKGDIGGNK